MVYGTIYTRFPVHFQPPRRNAAGGCQARLGSALSRKPSSPIVNSLVADFERMDISYCYAGVTEVEMQLILSSAVPERVREAQQEDRLLLHVQKRIHEGKVGDFTLDASGAVRFRGRLCVPQKSQVKEDILKKSHRSRYTVHPGENKM